MKKFIFSLFSIFILIALPLRAIELDDSMLKDISSEISNNLEPPTIVGPDDRKEITGIATGPEMAVVVIGSESSECSGAMVAPNIVLTSAHCLVDEKGNYEKGLTIYATGLPPEAAYGNFYPYAKAKALWVPNQYRKKAIIDNHILNQNREKYDYGFIILNDNLGNKTGLLGLKVQSDEELNKANITVIGRSGDKNFYSLWKSPGKIGKIKKYYIYYNADVIEGNSGGPVFKEDDPKNIIALHKIEFTFYNSIRHYPNGGLRIRQEIIDALKNLEKEISETNQK